VKLLLEKTFGIAQLDEVAATLKPILKSHRKAMFKGDVGAGKTTLVKALAKQFGVIHEVDSPTYSLVNEYEGEIGLFHFDLYRLKGIEELIDIGWEEYVESSHHVWVEWPENAPEAFDESFVLVKLQKLDNEKERRIQVFVF
jgi:tRNA threonylcarbamoyladenosine biosynthesis protein TsaE